MGYDIYYKDHNHRLSHISQGRWHEMRKLMPLLVEFVNERMKINWFVQSETELPERRDFAVDELIRDETHMEDKVFFLDAQELQRLFDWCGFLAPRNGAFALYKPLVEELKTFTRGIEQY